MLTNTYSNQYITDYLGRIIAVLSPPPDDLSYHQSVKRAANTMTEEAAKAQLNEEQQQHERGDNFMSFIVGLSYGNGHTKPTRRKSGRLTNLEDVLLGDIDIQRLASYQDGKLKIPIKSWSILNIFMIFSIFNKLLTHCGIRTLTDIIKQTWINSQKDIPT